MDGRTPRHQGIRPGLFGGLKAGSSDVDLNDAGAVRLVAKPLHDGRFELCGPELCSEDWLGHYGEGFLSCDFRAVMLGPCVPPLTISPLGAELAPPIQANGVQSFRRSAA